MLKATTATTAELTSANTTSKTNMYTVRIVSKTRISNLSAYYTTCW